MDNFRMKYEKVTLPIPITKDKWLTEVDFQDNTIHYVITLNNASDVAELLAEDLQNVKAECVAGMKEEVLVVNNEYLFFKENIHLIQTYKDSNGRELAKVVMSPEDLFD